MTYFDRPWFFLRSTFTPVICLIALAGCEAGLSLDEPVILAPTSDSVETIEIDVSVPEAFSITDLALGDGRPTFGGVWIAYPDIEQPERVRILNSETGKEVIGALYKRERDFPGPKIELSADAAASLGVQAGTPVELTIVALRRKTVEIVVEAEVSTEELDKTTPLRRPSATTTAAPVEKTETEITVAVDEIPAVDAPAPTPRVEPVISSSIEEMKLPPVGQNENSADGQSTYVQVATLQSKSRADVVVAKLRTAGLNVEIRERQVSDKTLYRIIVGPARSPEALEIMFSTVIELGFKDAIVLG